MDVRYGSLRALLVALSFGNLAIQVFLSLFGRPEVRITVWRARESSGSELRCGSLKVLDAGLRF